MHRADRVLALGPLWICSTAHKPNPQNSMLDSERYNEACKWFHLLVGRDADTQNEQLDRLRKEDASLAKFVGELLHADNAIEHDRFLEKTISPTRAGGKSELGAAGLRVGMPKTIGSFEIIDEIGKGGMGIVYRARDTKANRFVALKVIRSASFSSEEQIERFRREASAASQLEHTNIVRVYFVGTDKGTDFFTMELIEGEDLHSKRRNSPMESKEAAQLIRKIALALEFAHSRGIIHRDIKPGNILIDVTGEPKLLDFGLAKSPHADGANTKSNQLLGTLNYMAPEQINDAKNAGSQTDVYGLGATLYFCLTGKAPISGSDFVTVLQRLRETLPVPPRAIRADVDPDLELICLRCIQKEPCDRYESAAHLAIDLGRYLQGEPVEKAPVSWWNSLTRQIRRDEISAEMPSSIAAVWVAVLTLAFHSTVFLILFLNLGNIALWLALAVWMIATNAVNYIYHWSQFWQLAPLERQSGIIQLAVQVSFVCLFLIHGPWTFAESSQQFLKIYPPFTIVLAIAFVAHGNFFGRLLLPAFLFFPLSVLIAYVHPVCGPLILGFAGSAIAAWCAKKLLGARK